MTPTHYWLEKVAISNGTYNNERKPVVITYNVYKTYDCKQLGVFVGADLLWSKDTVLYLKPENDGNNSSPISIKVSDLFFAPKADFFLVTDMNKARGATKRGQNISFTSREPYYCDKKYAVKSELIRGINLVEQAPEANPITYLLDNEGAVKQVIDYVFSKPPLLFSVGAILRNEDGDQHLFADAGNAPHPDQLKINMERNRRDYDKKLHSGTRFGIASYFLYAKRIYKSVFKLNIGDYIVISIAYYPVVNPPETKDVEINNITGYYNNLIGNSENYKCSIYSFHLWRHALYGGFAGVAGGDYRNNGYTLKPECACRAFKLLLDAQTQPEYKRSWYHVLYYPTAFYLLLLYLATTKSDKIHNEQETNNAINDLMHIFKTSSDIEKQIQNDAYKKIVRRFTDEIGEKHLKIIMQEGLGDVRANSNAVKKYDNPIQMLWKYCMEKIVTKVQPRNNTIEGYLNNKIKDTDRIYRQILQREIQFFNT